ncbi:FGGY family carbohydrate kinase [Nocardioides sp. GXZ039]|uniref:FGGY family carbohydrate kinase n=1 Tax=Nocardioides sp. GXZ039 TaxID=3136018 RepID=UPI0030F43D67
MPLVLGVDSSTQSTKALLVDADDGTVVESRTAAHPPGTEVDPAAWLTAFDHAAGPLLARATAVSVGGQQHGMVALDRDGVPVRDALLWNDTRSAAAATELVAELGGPQACADAVGSVLVASFTAAKLRWLRDHEPDAAARVESVLLPHDYVSRHVSAAGTQAFTDRGDASGTGYFDAAGDGWRPDLLARALGREASVPVVVEGGTVAAETAAGNPVAAGTGDNMAAAMGIGLEPGDVLVSIGTSGVVSMVSPDPVADGTGTVTGFADAQHGFLPMATTMNAAGILDLQGRWLGVDHEELSQLALASGAGSGGLTFVPYYGGERTPNRPDATGTWRGLRPSTSRADLARAAFEALLCSLADARDLLVETSGAAPRRTLLVGGATRSPALQALAPSFLPGPLLLPPAGEYVALGAARQAAWALAGGSTPPAWPASDIVVLDEASDTDRQAAHDVRARYASARDADLVGG